MERVLVLRLVHTVVEKDVKSGSEDPRFILDYQIASETQLLVQDNSMYDTCLEHGLQR